VLTRDGWKPVADVCLSDVVAMLHPITQEVIWANPLRTHKYGYKGEMVRIKAASMDQFVTPNHRVACLTQRDKNLYYGYARDLGAASRIVPTGGSSFGSGAPLSDQEIELAAWLLTDGTIRPDLLMIYQSKPAMVKRIRALLDFLGIPYTETTRLRSTESICGVELKKLSLPGHEFYLHRTYDSSRLGLVDKVSLPAWTELLDARQVDIFLNTLIDGDGSRHKASPSSMMLYGTEEFLTNIQEFLTTRGYRAGLSFRKRNKEQEQSGYFVLNIVKRTSFTVAPKHVTREMFDGNVYCLTTPAGNFFARRNGKTFVTGNSSVTDRTGFDIIEGLVKGLNSADTEANILRGNYTGYIRFNFRINKTKQQSVLWYYTHGHGGGGEVTKGVLQAGRRAVYNPDAKIVSSGHIHEQWVMHYPRYRVTSTNKTYLDSQVHIQTGTYKEEYNDGKVSYHILKGRPPKPLGCTFFRFFYDRGKIKLAVETEFDMSSDLNSEST
jgi:hypothetical protein